MSSDATTYTVYELIDFEPFYVGVTERPLSTRLAEHRVQGNSRVRKRFVGGVQIQAALVTTDIDKAYALERALYDQCVDTMLQRRPAGRPPGAPDISKSTQQLIYALRADGLTLSDIAETLNSRDLPTRSGEGRWWPTQVRAELPTPKPQKTQESAVPEEMPLNVIDSADRAIENAQRVRRYHRRRTERNSLQRKADIEVALERLREAMKPLRSEIGRFAYGPATETAEANRKIIRERSAAIQSERRKLWKMMNRG